MKKKTLEDINTLEVYTTGQAAKVCRVAPRTLGKWCDTGKLKCYYLPINGTALGNHRRILREDLHSFLKEYGYPLEIFLPKTKSPLLVGCNQELLTRLTTTVKVAPTPYSAGVFIGSGFTPSLVVTDLTSDRAGMVEIVRLLKQDTPDLPAIALVAEDETQHRFLYDVGFTETMSYPFDITLLVERIAKG
jgi:CheY-like chemotaxis protein